MLPAGADMSSLPPLTQLAGNHGSLFEGYFQQLDVTRNGRIDASSAAAFLKKSQLSDSVLHKIWDLSDPNDRGYLDRQGFYAALRLVAACQLGKEPSLSLITLSDPPPRLMGIDSTTFAGFSQKKWTIEVHTINPLTHPRFLPMVCQLY
jgi:epidermal growth factor receptor substrate 15